MPLLDSTAPGPSRKHTNNERQDGCDNAREVSNNDHEGAGTEVDSSISTTNTSAHVERHLTLIDLLAIGVGGTIGSGLFVLTGLVAHRYAGPATVCSWALSGLAAGLSGCCYAELSGRIPRAGGAYAYTHAAMGEFPALLVATCLAINYVAASSAIARSWADKCIQWLSEELGNDQTWIESFFRPYSTVSPLACLISSACVALLLNGVKESKRVTNIFTALKAAVSVFMVVVGLYYAKPANWKPFLPDEFGVPGVMRGATALFFGYLGYDSICSLGGEAKNPKRDLPIAVLGTLGGVCILYITATIALTGMQSYQDISPISGFPHAFYSLNVNWAGQISAAGEIATLPIVVLITVMSAPRLMLAMSRDGLLPPYFRQVDATGNLYNGTLVAGSVMVLVATFVPFEHLNDMISFAVLSILNMTDTSLLLLWHEGPVSKPKLSVHLMLAYHAAALGTAHLCTQTLHTMQGLLLSVITGVCMIVISMLIYLWCPRSNRFGGRHSATVDTENSRDCDQDSEYFRTPFVPFWPCIAVAINWYLIAQLEWVGILSMLAVLALSCVYYLLYTTSTRVRSNIEWSQIASGQVEMTTIAGVSRQHSADS
jgi:basic amino acid/polyamine antiporter, APA family